MSGLPKLKTITIGWHKTEYFLTIITNPLSNQIKSDLSLCQKSTPGPNLRQYFLHEKILHNRYIKFSKVCNIC